MSQGQGFAGGEQPLTKSGPLTPTAESHIAKRKDCTPRYAWTIWKIKDSE